MKRNFISPGIILKLRQIRERDRLLEILTPDRGILSACAFGASLPRSKLRSATQLFFRGEMYFYENPVTNSIKMTDAAQVRSFTSGSLQSFCATSLLSEIVLIVHGGDSRQIYNLFDEYLRVLEGIDDGSGGAGAQRSAGSALNASRKGGLGAGSVPSNRNPSDERKDEQNNLLRLVNTALWKLLVIGGGQPDTEWDILRNCPIERSESTTYLAFEGGFTQRSAQKSPPKSSQRRAGERASGGTAGAAPIAASGAVSGTASASVAPIIQPSERAFLASLWGRSMHENLKVGLSAGADRRIFALCKCIFENLIGHPLKSLQTGLFP